MLAHNFTVVFAIIYDLQVEVKWMRGKLLKVYMTLDKDDPLKYAMVLELTQQASHSKSEMKAMNLAAK